MGSKLEVKNKKQKNKQVGFMQLIVYKHSGVTEIFFNIAYVRYWFLYKSFNTKKKTFLKKERTWALSSRGKSIWVPIFSVQFCTGTPLFPCFDVLTEAKNSTQEPNRRDFEDFLKSIYMSRTYRVIVPHLCASRLFALVPENITLMYGSVQFSRRPLWHTTSETNGSEPLQVCI